MMIDIGLKFYSIPSHPLSGSTGQGHKFRNFMLKYYIKFFLDFIVSKPFDQFKSYLYDDRY